MDVGAGGAPPTCLCHPDTYLNKVLLGCPDGRLELWNFASGQRVHAFPGWCAQGRGSRAAHDGRRDQAAASTKQERARACAGLRCCSRCSHAALWCCVPAACPCCCCAALRRRRSGVRCIAPSPALDVVGVGLADGRAVLFNLRRDAELMTLHNAAAAGTGAGRFLSGSAAAAAAAAANPAVSCLSFRTGAHGMTRMLAAWRACSPPRACACMLVRHLPCAAAPGVKHTALPPCRPACMPARRQALGCRCWLLAGLLAWWRCGTWRGAACMPCCATRTTGPCWACTFSPASRC